MSRGDTSRRGRRSAATLAALVLAACDSFEPFPDGGRTLSSFKVSLVGDVGAPDARLPLSRGQELLRVRAQAVDQLGRVLQSYTTKLDPATGCCVENCPTLRVTPGRLSHPGQRLLFREGIARQTLWTFISPQGGVGCQSPPIEADSDGALPVRVERVFSETFLWVEDAASELATGAAGPIWFADPAIPDIQFSPLLADNTQSPLAGEFVRTAEGDMIVTAIFAEGFYVTDLRARAGPSILDPSNPSRALPGKFESLYLFNFSYPENLRVGDRVKSISGTATDFSGATQLAFPAWERDPSGPYPSALPAPVRLTTQMCNAELARPDDFRAPSCGYLTSNWHLESLESSLVCATVKVSEEYVNCDYNQDGEVATANTFGGAWNCPVGPDGATDAECLCATSCVLGIGEHAGKVCTELSSFKRFGQWTGAFDGGAGPRILVTTKDGAPLFDPSSPENRGRTVSVIGPLRQVRAARPRWLIQLVDEQSLCIDPPCPNHRCE